MSAAKFTPGPWNWHGPYMAGAYKVTALESLPHGQTGGVRLSVFVDRRDGQDTEANARLIAAAPELLEALQGLEMFGPRAGEGYDDTFERVAEVFHRETGYLRPGKDCVLHSSQTRGAVWDDWIAKRRAAARAAIAKATGSAS